MKYRANEDRSPADEFATTANEDRSPADEFATRANEDRSPADEFATRANETYCQVLHHLHFHYLVKPRHANKMKTTAIPPVKIDYDWINSRQKFIVCFH